MIAPKVSKENADYVYKDISKVIKDTCIDIHKKIKVTSIKKRTILNKVRKSIFEKGYAEISSSLANFNAQKLNHYKDESDLFFGAYNTPCFVWVRSSMRDFKISRELAMDSSIMKIIILFGTPTKTFKGNSFIILDGTVSPKSIVINSDLISYSTKDLDSHSYEKLLKEANTLEKKLKKVYKDLYKLTSFKKS